MRSRSAVTSSTGESSPVRYSRPMRPIDAKKRFSSSTAAGCFELHRHRSIPEVDLPEQLQLSGEGVVERLRFLRPGLLRRPPVRLHQATDAPSPTGDSGGITS